MARKKSNKPEELLTRHIQTKVTESVYQRLSRTVKTTNCQTIGELARRILSREKIIFYYRDASMDNHLELLGGIEKELHSIGININQITRHFNGTNVPNQKMFYALKTAEQFKEVGDKVDQLLKVVSQLSRKWLRK